MATFQTRAVLEENAFMQFHVKEASLGDNAKVDSRHKLLENLMALK